MITRRSLLGGILAIGCAPAIVRVGSIMPVKVVEPIIRTDMDAAYWLNEFGDLMVIHHPLMPLDNTL